MQEKRYFGCLYPRLMKKVGVNPSGASKYQMLGSAACSLVNPYDPEIKVVPCGKCINCRLAYSRRWADRIVLESMYHEESWFVTLTYNDFFVPESKFIDDNTGEVISHLSLYKRDVQLFLKRLREMLDYPIRFFCAGEYGSKTLRPHYHLIIFGLKLKNLNYEDGKSDLYNPRRGQSGYDLFQSRLLERAWSKVLFDRVWPIGHVSVAPCNWQTAAYVARYVTKKLDCCSSDDYSRMNIQPPFSTCSRRPGLAYQYYLDHPEFADKGKVFYSTSDGSKQISYPSFFLDKLKVDDPEKYVIIKESRSASARRSWRSLNNMVDDLYKYLSDESDRASSTLKKLIRNEV